MVCIIKFSHHNMSIWEMIHAWNVSSRNRFMHESFLRFLRVGVLSRMMQPEMWLLPAAPSLTYIHVCSAVLWGSLIQKFFWCLVEIFKNKVNDVWSLILLTNRIRVLQMFIKCLKTNKLYEWVIKIWKNNICYLVLGLLWIWHHCEFVIFFVKLHMFFFLQKSPFYCIFCLGHDSFWSGN